MGPGKLRGASTKALKNTGFGRGDHGGKPSRRGSEGEGAFRASGSIRATAEAHLVIAKPIVVGRRGRPATISDRAPVAAFEGRNKRSFAAIGGRRPKMLLVQDPF